MKKTLVYIAVVLVLALTIGSGIGCIVVTGTLFGGLAPYLALFGFTSVVFYGTALWTCARDLI